MTIQRYTGENVEFHATGDMVAYEDYAELKEEYERLDKSHSVALAKIDNLAAENAALKSAHPQPFGSEMMKALDAYEKHQDEVPETGMLDAFFILRDSIRVETPATDAFIRQARAEGVEMCASKLDGLPCTIGVNQGFIMEFAAQLRSKSEVQS